MKLNSYLKWLLLGSVLAFGQRSDAQVVSGIVYRDYNGNGMRDSTATFVEPGVKNVAIFGYTNPPNPNIATLTDSYGRYSFNYVTPVRLELTINGSSPQCIDPLIDFHSKSGDGNNVRFITAPSSNVNFAINAKEDYLGSTNPKYYVPALTGGDPLATNAQAGYFKGMRSFNFEEVQLPSGPIGSPSQDTLGQTLPMSATGSLWGVAYSKQANVVFTSAFFRRNSGLGPLGSGGIYKLSPTATSYVKTNFYNMDTNGYRTRAVSTSAGAPQYGLGPTQSAFVSYSSFGVAREISYRGPLDPVSGDSIGLGVLGVNWAGFVGDPGRNLPTALNIPSYDAIAFDQVGKVGLGDLDISDDGKFLFVMNLYDRKVYRLELNDAYNPTSVIGVTSYALPAVAVTNGKLRGFGLSFHRNKLYVGAVSTGEYGGQNILNGATDLYAYVFEMENPTGVGSSFISAPALTFPLNYAKGNTNSVPGKWFPWNKRTDNVLGWYSMANYPTPMLCNISFTDNDDMVLHFMDRSSHQNTINNYANFGGSIINPGVAPGGDLVIAGKSCNGGYTLESAGSYTSSNGLIFTSGGFNNGQGIGGGEFFRGDSTFGLSESFLGAGAILRGTQKMVVSYNSGNHAAFSTMISTTDGQRSSNNLQIASMLGIGNCSFGGVMGDIELQSFLPPIEIGNRVWNDNNADGVQDPGEIGIANVSVQLFADFDNNGIPDGAALSTVITNSEGEYYFNTSNVTDGNPSQAGNQAGPQANKKYLIRIGSASWSSGAGVGVLDGKALTILDSGGNGDADVRDNDAILVSTIPQIVVFTGTEGQNNFNYDFGFKPLVSCIGNYVWNDENQNGIQDAGEVGVSGITVSLLNASTNAILSTLTTDAYGKYQFCNIAAGNYKVKFTLPSNYEFTVANNPISDLTDSDPDPASGITPSVSIVLGDSNMTLDAGIYQPIPPIAKVGDKVWFDLDNDGLQDVNETGLSGITVSLYNCANQGTPIATTITNGNGMYLFENVAPGSYSIGISIPIGMVLSPNAGSTNDADNSDIIVNTERSSCFIVNPGDSITYIDAGLTLKPVTTASLGDRIWYDSDQDGIQDAFETGIQGVSVTLYDATGNNVLGVTSSDALGYYHFHDLVAGCYVVGFVLPANYAFSPQNVGADSMVNSDANPLTSKTNVVCISAGYNNPSIDAGVYNSNLLINNSIGDKVWHDIDHDGIQDINEPGFPGVVVSLYDCSSTALLSTTTTDVNGNYLFNGLANGNYYISFGFIPGYQFTSANSDQLGILGGANSDADPSTGLTGCVAVSGGIAINSVDAGIYPGSNRSATSSLGDKAWLDVNANGLQDNGEPGVPNIKVTLFDDDSVTILDSASTDGQGNYIFTGLTGGNYIVGFTNLPVGYSFTSKIGVIDDEENSDVNPATAKTDIISLGLGEDKMSVDAGLLAPVGTVCLGNYVWIDLNQNGLQDNNELPVEGISVSLYSGGSSTVLQTTTTDADGKYLFCGLTSGISYSVGFANLPNGFTFTSNLGVVSDTNNSDVDPNTGRTSVITLGVSDNLDIDAGIFSSSTSIVGNYVWYDFNGNGIQEVTESGIPGVLVSMYNSNNVIVSSAVTDANGGYLFMNVVPGDYTIGFTGYPSNLIPTVKGSISSADDDSNVDPQTGKTESFTVLAGSSNLTLDAGYKPQPIAGLGNYVWNDINFNGVQDASEPSISGVLVTLFEQDGTTALATTITDGNGGYSFRNISPGTYIVGFSNLPSGFTRTQKLGVLNDPLNSDVNSNNKTDVVTLVNGDYNDNLDAGYYIGLPLSVRDLVATFAQIQENGKCKVQWYSEDEMNVLQYDIERSFDGLNFEKVGQEDALGNTTIKTNYNFLDDISSVDVNSPIYYRIKMSDIDNNKVYSNVVKASNKDMETTGVLVYPSPFKDKLDIVYTSKAEGNLHISLLDAVGKIVTNRLVSTVAGENIITLNGLSDLPKGQYYLRISDDETSESFIQKLVK